MYIDLHSLKICHCFVVSVVLVWKFSGVQNMGSERLWMQVCELVLLFSTVHYFQMSTIVVSALQLIPSSWVVFDTCIWWFSQVGIVIAARKYDLDVVAPFSTSDFLDVRPVVKHSIPVCSEAKDLVETGKVQLAEVWTVCLLYYQKVGSSFQQLCVEEVRTKLTRNGGEAMCMLEEIVLYLLNSFAELKTLANSFREVIVCKL